MRDVTIQDYIGNKKELTAEQVKKLPVGSKVVVHSFDRYSSHVTLTMTVVQSGRKKILKTNDFYLGTIEKPIRQTTDRMTYTEV